MPLLNGETKTNQFLLLDEYSASINGRLHPL